MSLKTPLAIDTNLDSDDLSKEQIDALVQNKLDNNLRSCCGGSTDRRLILVSVQAIVSVTIMTFSFYQISTGHQSDLSVSLLSSVLSYWLGRSNPDH